MQSLFSKLFTIAKSEKNRIEDFLTEILTHCLRQGNNTTLFLQYFKIFFDRDETFEVLTQVSKPKLDAHDDSSKIDLIISGNKKTMVYLENKVGSTEGTNKEGERDQLRKYYDHLMRETKRGIKYESKTLLYVTHDYEPHRYKFEYRRIRWFEICNFLKTITSTDQNFDNFHLELINYLKDLNMDFEPKLTPELLLATNQIRKVHKFFSELFTGLLKERLEKVLGSPVQTSFDSSKDTPFKIKANLQNYDGATVFLYIDVKDTDFPYAKILFEDWKGINEIKFLQQKLLQTYSNNGWYEEYEGGIVNKESLTTFTKSEDHLNEIRKYFLDRLDEIEATIGLVASKHSTNEQSNT